MEIHLPLLIVFVGPGLMPGGRRAGAASGPAGKMPALRRARLYAGPSQLFSTLPATIAKKANWFREFYEKGYIAPENPSSPNVLSNLTKMPMALTYATENMHLRAIHAHVMGRKYSLHHFFNGDNRKHAHIEAQVTSHYQKIFEESAGTKGAATVRTLTKAGILSTLPDWAFEKQVPSLAA